MALASSQIRRKLRKPYKISAQLVAEDNDLMAEILLRLPAKSVIKCKRVSKQFRALISSDWFARRFHELSLKKNKSFGLLIYSQARFYGPRMYLSLNDTDENRQRQRVRLPGNFPRNKVQMLQSCNGLFLCFYGAYRGKNNLLVCNASLMQSVEIPPVIFKCDNPVLRGYGYGLAFDPLRSPEFKVVALAASSDYTYSVKIYSSTNRSWRRAKGRKVFRSHSGVPVIYYCGVYHKGVVYWFLQKIGTIISFCLDKECVKPLESSPPRLAPAGTLTVCYFGSSGDHLQLIEKSVERQYFVYEMNIDHSAEWLVKYVVNMNDINTFSSSNDILNHFNSTVLSIVETEEEEEVALVIELVDKIVYYSLKNKTTKLLRDRNSPGSQAFFKTFKPHMIDWRHVFKYYETIYSVRGNSTFTRE